MLSVAENDGPDVTLGKESRRDSDDAGGVHHQAESTAKEPPSVVFPTLRGSACSPAVPRPPSGRSAGFVRRSGTAVQETPEKSPDTAATQPTDGPLPVAPRPPLLTPPRGPTPRRPQLPSRAAPRPPAGSAASYARAASDKARVDIAETVEPPPAPAPEGDRRADGGAAALAALAMGEAAARHSLRDAEHSTRALLARWEAEARSAVPQRRTLAQCRAEASRVRQSWEAFAALARERPFAVPRAPPRASAPPSLPSERLRAWCADVRRCRVRPLNDAVQLLPASRHERTRIRAMLFEEEVGELFRVYFPGAETDVRVTPNFCDTGKFRPRTEVDFRRVSDYVTPDAIGIDPDTGRVVIVECKSFATPLPETRQISALKALAQYGGWVCGGGRGTFQMNFSFAEADVYVVQPSVKGKLTVVRVDLVKYVSN